MPIQTQFITIHTGESVSTRFGLGNALSVAFWLPEVNSCEVFLQASFDTVSAHFFRVGSAAWAAGTGRAVLVLDWPKPPIPNARIETGVAQSETRTLAILTRT